MSYNEITWKEEKEKEGRGSGGGRRGRGGREWCYVERKENILAREERRYPLILRKGKKEDSKGEGKEGKKYQS